jgi:hypothetical protein
LRGGQRVRLRLENAKLRREATTWHPEFGRSLPTVGLIAEFSASLMRTRLEWGPEA